MVSYANLAFGSLLSWVPDDADQYSLIEIVNTVEAERAASMLDHVYETGEAQYAADLGESRHQPGARIICTIWPTRYEGQSVGLIVQVNAVLTLAEELRTANQHLLLAGLDAQAQTDEAQRRLVQLTALLKSLGEAVTVVDAAGNLVLMNRAAEDLFGPNVPGESWLPQAGSQTNQWGPDGTPLPLADWSINRVLRGEQFENYETTYLGLDAERRVLVASGSALRDEAGHVRLGIIVHRDVTVQRQLEQQKEILLATLAHDLKTPLTTVQGYTELLLRRLNRGETLDAQRSQEALERIVNTVRRTVVQIDDVLERHRNPSPDARAGRELPIDLAPLVRRVVSEHEQTRDDCTISLQIDEGALIGAWDASDIERVLSNLLSNAIKYSVGACRIEVRVHLELGRDGQQVTLSVRDEGIGIPVDELSRIFEHNYRASNVGTIPGLGIGLAGVNDIIRQYGGTISAHSGEEGTTMVVRLPLRRSVSPGTPPDV